MTEKDKHVGLIGLGLMGLPMAENLLNAGMRLSVFNRTASKAAPLVERGAECAASPADLANRVQGGIIIICVSDTPNMLTTVAALAKGELAGSLVIDMGTSRVDATRLAAGIVAEGGGRFVDAPVSGGAVGAAAGTLSIMAGGDEADIARAEHVFECLGSANTHIGPLGSGQVAKAANQAIVGATIAVVGEAMLLGEAAGVDLSKMREALLRGFAGSRILELHGQRMIERSFEPGARAATQAKDLDQTDGLAQSLGLTLPLMSCSNQLWQDILAKGMGDLDQSGYFAYARSLQQQRNS